MNVNYFRALLHNYYISSNLILDIIQLAESSVENSCEYWKRIEEDITDLLQSKKGIGELLEGVKKEIKDIKAQIKQIEAKKGISDDDQEQLEALNNDLEGYLEFEKSTNQIFEEQKRQIKKAQEMQKKYCS